MAGRDGGDAVRAKTLAPVCAALLLAGLSCGCVATYFRVPGGPRGLRISVLYPFRMDRFDLTTTNTVFKLSGYVTEGANSNTVEFASNVTESLTEGIVNGLVQKGAVIREKAE